MMIFLRSIRLGSLVSFQGSFQVGVSFVPLPVFSPFLRLLRPCVVSSWIHHHLLIYIATFINLLLMLSIDSNRYREMDDGCNYGVSEGVEGFGDP